MLLALAVLCFTRCGHRRRAARQLLHPIRTVICLLLVAMALPWAASLLGHTVGHGLTAELVPELLSPLVYAWYWIFMCCAI